MTYIPMQKHLDHGPDVAMTERESFDEIIEEYAGGDEEAAEDRDADD